MITGTLDDYDLMTEGVHAGRYGARIDGKPYPVMQHVDPFLLRHQKGVHVEVTLKNIDGEDWISKIARPKVMGSTHSKVETTAMTAAKKAEQAAVLAEPGIDEKLKNSGFNLPTGENTVKRTSPIDSPENIDRINREADEHGKRQQAEIAARKATQNPASVTQLVPTHQDIIPATIFNNDQINLIKATVARGCTNTEFELLMYLSAQYGLDPIRRQIWAVKYGNAPASIFTGRDGFLEIAHRSGTFDGMESGVKTVREGEKDELIGWCKVYRKDMSHPFYVEVYEREYTTGQSLWQTKPRIMIQKVAESSCLRRAFSVSGLYCPEEMPEQGGA